MTSINQNIELKYYRLDQYLIQAGVDALVCMIPENIVYLTGTYPVHGVSVAVYIPGGHSLLLTPECEQDWVETNRTKVSLFGWGHLHDQPLETSHSAFLTNVYKQYLSDGMQIGIERQFRTIAPAFRSAENILPDSSWIDLVSRNLPGCKLKDCISLIEAARAIKTPEEIEKIRRANLIALIGLNELANTIHPGMTEVESASLVENTIRIKGTGFEGARLVRAFAEVTSGPEGSCRQSMLVPAGQRRFENGDLVIIELAVVVDGYWSDLTRVYCVGDPTTEQKRIYNTILEAQQSGVEALIPGNKFSDPDTAARRVIKEAGLGEYFIHGTGHGVGYRYHESIPQLGPGLGDTLERGMVTSVEPGVYIPGFGGIRIEDNVSVGENGPIWLSKPPELW